MKFCDECPMLMIEAPINKYDVWRAHCCDPKKPVPGARRVVGTAPASSETGPIRIQTPAWCRRAGNTSSAPAGHLPLKGKA